jgi:hypothetical protein
MQRVLLASLILAVLFSMALNGQAEKASSRSVEAKKLRVVDVGAHPDDPESGCGGLIARLTQAEHEVFVGWNRVLTLACHRPLKPSMAAWKPVSRGGTKTGTTPRLRQTRATRPMVSGWICGPSKSGSLSNCA